MVVPVFGTAEEDRELVADQLAATAGEDRRQAGRACPVLLADAGCDSPDQATVWDDGRKDRPLCRCRPVDGCDGRREFGRPGGGAGKVFVECT
jgi:hypothetical protein